MAIAPQDWFDAGESPRRPVLTAVARALGSLEKSEPGRTWALADGEVGEALHLVGRLSATVDALLVTLLGEAKQRSLGAGDGWGTLDWARAQAPQLPDRVLSDADAVAGGMSELRLADVVEAVTDVIEGPRSAGASAVGEPVTDYLPVGKAAQIVRFHRSVRGLADAAQLEGVTATLLEEARGPRGANEKVLAAALRRTGNLLRPDRLVEHDADVARAHRSLVKSAGPVGLSRYTLLLDAEGAAVVDAAVDALAKPHRDPETGERDPRTPACRRADALLDLVRRAVEAPGELPRASKATLVVTVPLQVLEGRLRGVGVTTTHDQQDLSADTVRRIACDASVVPAVLGSRGEVFEQGRSERLFTAGQVRHLWLRDGGCTFPGCSKPPAWTDAHHLVHWFDHGPTDIANAALLCRAHHTVVHRERYAGAVVTDEQGRPSVQWYLVPGAYDDQVEAMRRAGTLPRPAVELDVDKADLGDPPVELDVDEALLGEPGVELDVDEIGLGDPPPRRPRPCP